MSKKAKIIYLTSASCPSAGRSLVMNSSSGLQPQQILAEQVKSSYVSVAWLHFFATVQVLSPAPLKADMHQQLTYRHD